MSKPKLAYFLIIASSILLVVNVYRLDFNNLQNGSYGGIITNLLLIIAMIFNIRDFKNQEK
jgi:hypothetical protein